MIRFLLIVMALHCLLMAACAYNEPAQPEQSQSWLAASEVVDKLLADKEKVGHAYREAVRDTPNPCVLYAHGHMAALVFGGVEREVASRISAAKRDWIIEDPILTVTLAGHDYTERFLHDITAQESRAIQELQKKGYRVGPFALYVRVLPAEVFGEMSGSSTLEHLLIMPFQISPIIEHKGEAHRARITAILTGEHDDPLKAIPPSALIVYGSN